METHHLSSQQKKGHPKVARLLLQSGADINKGNCDGDTPLLMAALKGHLDLAWLLLESCADSTIRPTQGPNSGMTAEEVAIQWGHHEVARIIRVIPRRHG